MRSPDHALTYTYDPAGNRLSQTRANAAASNLPTAVAAAQITYDASNELLRWNNATNNLTYDLNENLATETVGGVTTTYTWNSRNRLTGISKTGLTASFVYDGLGRRTSKTINGTTTVFWYDGNDVYAELSGATPSFTYLRGLSIDEPYIRKGASDEFYETDALGSSVALTNSAGASQTTYTYEPFGTTTQASTASTNPFQFTGRENDGTGLYYYRARYYYPKVQRFGSEDPMYSPSRSAKGCQTNFAPRTSRYVEIDSELSRLIAIRFYSAAGAIAVNVQEIPLYTYVNDTPVNRIDPSGLRAQPQTPGCDVVGGRGGFFDSPCAVKCCNAHDRCYEEADDFCDQSSWTRWIPPNQCTTCNLGVLRCLADAYMGYLGGRKGCS